MTVTLKLNDPHADSSSRRTLTDISLAVAKSKKIVVVTGAGISCSCGIPDFRSSDGLYALVKKRYPDVVLKGRDLFDASLFRDATSTAVFYTFISQLKQSIDGASPSPTHQFIKTLDAKKKLLRSYTQNIDGLEAQVGLVGSSSQEAQNASEKGKIKLKAKEVRNVQLHGDIHRVRCVSCAAEYPCTPQHLEMFNQGLPPDCPECLSRAEARAARSARPLRVGTLRPAIVLYDEPHPLGDEIGVIHTSDLGRKPDMLIIMGTSLKVHGLRKLVKDFARAVHASTPVPTTGTSSSSKKLARKVIFVNRTPPAGEWAEVIDYHVMGDTDTWVEKVVEDWKKHRPADWEVQTTLVASDSGDAIMKSPKVLKSIKSSTAAKATTKTEKPKASNKVRPVESIENIPSSMDMVISPSPKPPASPTKRRKQVSHYSNVETSPSKRPSGRHKKMGGLEDDDRKLLFKERTNNQPVQVVWDDDEIF